MTLFIAMASLVVILFVLFEAFETLLLPRRVTRRFRLTRWFYILSWRPWAAMARRLGPGKRRNSLLSWFGPLSLLALFGIWAVSLIVGFALLQQSIGTPLTSMKRPELGDYLYFSGVTFFTLGYGDVTPTHPAGRFLAVLETGVGFGFLAIVIGYLPVLYQAFSRREVTISLFDARAGSPPTAGTLLERHAKYDRSVLLDQFLAEWERWAAEVLESHVSFPVLSYYRSQHDNQSWLAALTAVLDASALILAGLSDAARAQAYLTFAMARHVVVDLAQAIDCPPIDPPTDRLPPEQLRALRQSLDKAGMELRDGEAVERRLAELRGMYEPFVEGLSQRLLMALPPVVREGEPVDNWQTSAWMRRARGFGQLAAAEATDDHES